MVADVDVDTGVVAITKEASDDPAGIVTADGTSAEVRLLDSVMTILAAAVPVRVTVPVDEVPPITLVGLSASDERVGGFTVRVAVRVVPANVPEIVTLVEVVTGTVLTVNVAVVRPAATAIVTGVWAAEVLLLERATLKPPAGATDPRVTVPVDDLPPIKVLGLNPTDASVGGFTVKVVDRLLPLTPAVSVTVV